MNENEEIEKMEQKEVYKLPEPVYYVESEEDSTVQVGIDVTKINDKMTWFDTIKERGMMIDYIVDSSPEHFVFNRSKQEGGGTYSFVPMDLEIYNSKVKSNLIDGKDFNDKNKMIEAFLETKENNAW